MKKLDINDNSILRKINEKVHNRLGDNIYLIMGIMSILLVFSGLVVGLLGRGWLGAWFLVLLGLILGFFPCLSYLIGNKEEELYEEPIKARYTDGMESPMQRKKRLERERADRTAIEFEAMLAKDRIRKQEELRRREEELIRQERRVLFEAKERERQKLLEEERKKREKEAAERKRREDDARRRRTGGSNVYKAKSQKKNENQFFNGVSSMAELKKRYKELLKQYHPDNRGGDAEIMMKIQREYEELERFFKSYEKHSSGK